MVNMENYEELMLLAADGELGDAELEELQEFIRQNPELENEWRLYMSVRLQPEESLVYTGKETLLKKETKTITLGKWWLYTAAACVAILIAIPLLRTGEERKPLEIAKTKTTISEPPIKTEPPSPENKPGPAERSEAVAKTGLATQLPRVKKTVIPQPVRVAEQKVQEEQPQEEPMIAEVKPRPEPRSPLVDTSAIAVVEKTKPVEPIEAGEGEDNKNDIFAWVPLDEGKKKGLTDLSAAITERVEKVKEIKNTIKNADVSFKIGRNELFTVKF